MKKITIMVLSFLIFNFNANAESVGDYRLKCSGDKEITEDSITACALQFMAEVRGILTIYDGKALPFCFDSMMNKGFEGTFYAYMNYSKRINDSEKFKDTIMPYLKNEFPLNQCPS